jgi:Sec-independent protein translocase protein TatA
MSIIIVVIVALFLVGTHYLAYTLGEDASTARWMRNLRELQARFDLFMQDNLKVKDAGSEVVKKIAVGKIRKPRKLAIKKK